MQTSRPITLLVLISLVVLVCAPGATPQTVPNSLNTGYPENSIFHGSEIDNVQLENGNLHVTIPIWSEKGRGLNTGYNFVYDNHGFRFITRCYTGGGGFCQDTVTIDPLSPMALQGLGPMNYQFGILAGGSVNCSGTWIYTMGGLFLREPDGTKHHFSPDPIATNIGACGYVMQSTVYADDGSGWIMQLDLANARPAYATNKNGTKVLYSGGVTDANGNQINWNSSTQQWTDTLGRVISNGSYYDSSGTLQSVSTTTTNGRITQIVLPNNHGTYTFTYAPTIPTQICQFSTADQCFEYSGGGGEIASIALPTGGQISYTWGIWDEGGRRVASRTVSANGVTGTWNYQYTFVDNPVVVTDPAGKDMKLTSSVSGCLQTGSETLQYYDGAAGVGPLIKTVQTDYNCQLAAVFNGHIPLPIRVTTTWNQQNLVSKVETDWDLKTVATNETFTWKNPIERREYDWGTGAPGALVRRTHYNYLHLQNSTYLNANIADRPTSKVVYDGASNIMAQTTYTYDGTAVQGTSGAPGHDYTNYSSTNNVRGNLTQTSRWLNANSTWLSTTNAYNDLGDLLSTTDPRSNTTNFSYADNFTDGVNRNALAFVTQTTYPTTNGVSHIERKQYYWNTSLAAASCGQNFPAASACTNTATIPQPDYTSYTYDLMNRALNITRGDGGQTNFSYNDTVQPLSISSTQFITGSTSLAKTTLLDGMGRTKQTQLTSDPDCPSGDKTDTTYDGLGQVYTVSNPYCTTSDSTYGLTTYTYDALGRITQVTHPDNSTVLTTYAGRATQVQDEGNGTQRVTRISQTDALGRLMSVCEVTGASLLGSGGTPAACGQDIAATGFLTTYQYDALGNLLQVNQSGLNPRSFTYDSLSRLTSASNPESGKICYGTVSAGVCQANGYDANGNVVTKTDSRGITTTFSYDPLNRLTGKTYSDGTPAGTFTYDQSSALGVALTNTIGRRSSESTAGPNATGSVFSYDNMGRLVDNSQCTPLNCGGGVFSFQYPQYDFLGDLLAATNAGGVTVNYSYNGAAHLTTMTTNLVDGSHPGTLFSNAHYGPIGLANDTLGNGIIESLSYNNRGWLQSFAVTSGTNPRYSFSVGTFAPNGDILAANDSVNGNWTYTYDPFNRLLTATAPGQAYTYDYDRFGNRWHQNGPRSSQLGFDANNRIVSGSGVTYDANGNVTADGSHSYAFDAENRISSVDGGATASYVYDAEGRRARKTTASAGSVDYLYDLAGHQVAEVGATGVFNRGELYTGNRHLLTYTAGANGSTFFTHSDWLGTERARTDMSPSTCESIASLPFGDGQSISGTCGDVSPMHFTGKERDSESGLDNFGARYNSSSMGRFMSPDSTAYVKPINPQSWNLYAYARNNPLLYVDPTGNTVSLANCQDKNKCVQVLTNGAQLPKGVTAEVDKKGNLVLKGDLSKIKGGNAARLLQLVQSDKTANFWIGDTAPKLGGGTQSVAGGTSGLTSQGFNQNFSVVQADPSKVDSGDLHGVFLNSDGSATPGDIPGADIEETAAHELLGHVWADLIGGQSAGTDENKREALIAEDRVRNTDPARGLKIRHQGQQNSVQLIRVSDVPRITNPGSEP